MARQSWTPASTCIARVDFETDEEDDTMGTAYVRFQQGQGITIENFPAIEFERWQQADSAGEYWNYTLRGTY